MDKLFVEMIETFEYFKKDTKRKRIIMLNKDLKELQERVDYLQTGFNSGGYKDYFGIYALYLGVKYRKEDLIRLKSELQYYRENFDALVTVN